MSTQPVPNAYCIVHGTQGQPGFMIEGPFATQEEANANLAVDESKVASPAVVLVLVNPANC